MIAKTKTLLHQLLNIGITDHLIPYEKHRARVFNYCNLGGFLIAVVRLIYLAFISDYQYSPLVLAINAIPLLICGAMTLCVQKERYKLAITISFIFFPPVLMLMGIYTNDNGIEIFLFLYIMFTFFYLHQRRQIIIAFCWVTVCFLVVHFSLQNWVLNQRTGLPHNSVLSILDYGSGLLFIFFTLYFIKFEVWKFEKSIRQKTAELTKLNNVKDKVFSVISHDLKSPIGSIIMFLRGIEKAGMTTESFNSYLPELRANMEQTGDLLDNLLIWARSQIKNTEEQAHEISLTRLVQQTLRFFERNATQKGITLINEVPNDCLAYADVNAVQIVLRNLITNAIKFTSAGGQITVGAIFAGNLVEISVTDTGVGIPAEKQSLLFGEYYYTTPGTNKETGTGLGLLICRDLVARNGGSLIFMSEAGKGSTFRFTLPVAE